MLIYTVVIPPIGIYPDFLLITNYTMVDVLVVQIQILYYIHNTMLSSENGIFIYKLQ